MRQDEIDFLRTALEDARTREAALREALNALQDAVEPILADLLNTYYDDEEPDNAHWEDHAIPWGQTKRLRAASSLVKQVLERGSLDNA